jgi:two-component system CheB/CheR fusion protein
MRRDSFIVAIGASAGGESALYDFVENLPRNLPATYIIVRHLKKDYQSQMKFLISRHTSLPIFTIRDGEPIQENAIYLIPEQKDVSIDGDHFGLQDRPSTSSSGIDLDKFFIELAEAVGNRAIGVILSGIGADGAAGFDAIESRGGLVIIQDPKAAKFERQPNSLIADDYPESVLPARVMGQYLAEYINAHA